MEAYNQSRCHILMFAALLALLAGCGGQGRERELMALREATVERKAEFAGAVVRACAGFEGLDGDDVKFEIVTNATDCTITVNGGKEKPPVFQEALSVALTNLSLEYPGLGFMQNDDGNTWKILMPDDVRIPVSGGFGIGGK